MMKDISIIILVVAFAVILFLCFYYPNKITGMKNVQDSLSEFTASMQMRTEFHELNFDLNSKMTGLNASDALCLERINEGKHLSELVREKPLLIFRYAQITCRMCYEAELKVLNDVFITNPDLVVILCSNNVIRDFLIYKRSNKIEISIFNIPNDTFSWIAEENDSQYFFVLHPDMKISHIFVPNKEYPELSKQYLEGVKRFLSE